MIPPAQNRRTRLLLIVGLVLAAQPCHPFMPAGQGLVVHKFNNNNNNRNQHPTAAPRVAASTALFSATQNYTFGIDGFLMREEQNYQEEMRRHESSISSSEEEKRWQEARRLAEEARLQGQQLRGGHNARWLAEKQSYRAGYEGQQLGEEVVTKAEYTQQLAEQARRQGQILDGGIFENGNPGTSRLKERQQQQIKEAQREAARIAEEQRLAQEAQARLEEQRRQEEFLKSRHIQDLNRGQSRQQVLMNGGGLDRESSAARAKPMTPEERKLAQEAMEEERRRSEAARIYQELQIEHQLKAQRLQEEIDYCQKLSLSELKQEIEERGIPGRFHERWEYVLAVAKARDAEGYVEVSDVEVLTDEQEVEMEASDSRFLADTTPSSKSYPSQGPKPGSAVQREPPITTPYTYSYSSEGASDGKRDYDWNAYSFTYPTTRAPSQPSASSSYQYSNPAPSQQREETFRWEYTTPDAAYARPKSAFNSPYTAPGTSDVFNKQQQRHNPRTASSQNTNPAAPGAAPGQQNAAFQGPYGQSASAGSSNQQQSTTHPYASTTEPIPYRQESAFNAPFSQGSQAAAPAHTEAAKRNTEQTQTTRQNGAVSGAGSRPVQPYTPYFSGNPNMERESTSGHQAANKESFFDRQRGVHSGGARSNVQVLDVNDPMSNGLHPNQPSFNDRLRKETVQELRTSSSSHRPEGSHYVTYEE